MEIIEPTGSPDGGSLIVAVNLSNDSCSCTSSSLLNPHHIVTITTIKSREVPDQPITNFQLVHNNSRFFSTLLRSAHAHISPESHSAMAVSPRLRNVSSLGPTKLSMAARTSPHFGSSRNLGNWPRNRSA